jgi:hypothetical protein
MHWHKAKQSPMWSIAREAIDSADRVIQTTLVLLHDTDARACCSGAARAAEVVTASVRDVSA